MKCKWKTIAFEELLEEPVRNGLTKPRAIRGKGVKMIAMGEVFSYSRIADIATERVPVTKKELQNCSIKPLDILFARQSLTLEGAGKCSIVIEVSEETIFESHLIRIRVNQRKADPFFLYYYFNSPHGRSNIKSIVEQVSAAGIRGSDLIKLLVPYPPMEIQQKITAILSALDDKIELNNKINANLEQQAQALFKAWFVDFEPFGGKMPEDWGRISLSAIADFVSGYSYKGGELQPSTTAMVTIKNFDRAGGFKLDGFKELIPSSKIKRCHYAEKFDTVVAHTDLTQKAEVIGNAEIILNLSGYKSIVFSMDLVKVLPKAGGVSKFLLAALLKDPRFKAHCLAYVSGTTVLHLGKKALPDYMLSFPKNWDVLAPLDAALAAFYTKMATLVDENCRLRVLRNTLLPKLMSGAMA